MVKEIGAAIHLPPEGGSILANFWMNILQKISEEASKLTEQDLDWIVPEVSEHYSDKLRYLASYSFNSSFGTNGEGRNLAYRAFAEYANEEIRKGLNAYLFVSEHWRTDRDINSYILTCLNRLSNRIKNDVDNIKKVNIPICPCCKMYGEREYLKYEGKLLRCHNCFLKIDRLEDQIKSSIDNTVSMDIRSELYLRRVFSFHSRIGFRCPDCEMFIPKSYFETNGISCPYNTCSWFGQSDVNLESMVHPLGLGIANITVSLDANVDNGKGDASYNNSELKNLISSENISAESQIVLGEQFKNELKLLNEVIDAQLDGINRNEPQERSIQKRLMYQAYKNIINQYPEDMVCYLVRLKHYSSDQPIQSRIFQEYVRLIENSLPLTITKGKQKAEIYSLLDPNLKLFLGLSEYDGVVSGNIISNNTIETYTGGRKMKFFGPCFIGLLIDVEDKTTGESIKSQVKNYTFSQIRMKESVENGTIVKVSHFRMPSHYEIGTGLILLQRIRRAVVDSVFFRIHKTKRIVKPGVNYDHCT